jgi:hypothetical protein
VDGLIWVFGSFGVDPRGARSLLSGPPCPLLRFGSWSREGWGSRGEHCRNARRFYLLWAGLPCGPLPFV